ncbi:putative secreted protein [Neisseria meningitidis]|nr:putative secreted protein [Neisseria meningitidis]
MKPAVWAALLLCACTSNFGDREHQFLRYSGLTKTSTAVASPYRTICTVCGFVFVLIFVNPLYHNGRGNRTNGC